MHNPYPRHPAPCRFNDAHCVWQAMRSATTKRDGGLMPKKVETITANQASSVNTVSTMSMIRGQTKSLSTPLASYLVVLVLKALQGKLPRLMPRNRPPTLSIHSASVRRCLYTASVSTSERCRCSTVDSSRMCLIESTTFSFNPYPVLLENANLPEARKDSGCRLNFNTNSNLSLFLATSQDIPFTTGR
jgi:hypothetical protein